MKKKFYFVILLFLLFSIYFSEISFAKYIFQNTLQLWIYIDKTPPTIFLKNNGIEESYQNMPNDIIKKNSSVTVKTTDNIGIERNYFYYNSLDSNFLGIVSTEFEDEITLVEEGYYKIVAVDTSGNTTEIIFLIDTSAPVVNVTYYKKNEIMSFIHNNVNIRKVVGKHQKFATEEIIKENNEEIQEDTEIEEILDVEEEIIDYNEIEETDEENKNLENLEDDSENIDEDLNNDEILEQNFLENTEGISEINQETDSIFEEMIVENDKEGIEENIINQNQDCQVFNAVQSSGLILMAGGDWYVGNEDEFRNALNNQASVIYVRQSINFQSPIYVNYPVRIVCTSDSNALRYGNYGGNFIVVQNGGNLTICSMVIDTNSLGATKINTIAIENGGCLTLESSTIIDGGIENTGIVLFGGGTLNLKSSEIVNCGYGINLQENGNLSFQTEGERTNNFHYNATAIFIDNFFGNCNLNQNIYMHDNIYYGVYVEKSSGNINISSGTYFNNTYCIHTRYIMGGSFIISGGSYHDNGWAICVGGNLVLAGGDIFNNYYGVFTDENYLGSFSMTGGYIHENKSFAICHEKTNDGGCTVIGGTILGEVYLSKDDNYINTNSSYTVFTVTPSTYYYKRKLVKTTNNEFANNEIINVTLTEQYPWYKYVDNEYIVLYNQESKVAKVNFEDLLSGVVSAKYWYNSNSQMFDGNGIDFANGAIFEEYGYYRVVVVNSVGLQTERIFLLNENSLTQ